MEFCDSRVGVDGFAGERYQLEFFLPDFNPAGCGGDADGGGLRRVLESMPKEVRKPMRSEAMYEAVEAWLQERLKREEDQGMEIDSKPRRASSRKGKETIAVKLEQEEEGMEMNSKPTRASSRKVKGTVTVSVELEREDDSMEIDTTPRPASSPRKRKEGPVNLDIRSKRLKLSRKTPRRPQGLDSHGTYHDPLHPTPSSTLGSCNRRDLAKTSSSASKLPLRTSIRHFKKDITVQANVHNNKAATPHRPRDHDEPQPPPPPPPKSSARKTTTIPRNHGVSARNQKAIDE